MTANRLTLPSSGTVPRLLDDVATVDRGHPVALFLAILLGHYKAPRAFMSSAPHAVEVCLHLRREILRRRVRAQPDVVLPQEMIQRLLIRLDLVELLTVVVRVVRDGDHVLRFVRRSEEHTSELQSH